MEKDNLIKGMLGIMVCIILLGGLLLPVVSNALDNERVIVNNLMYNSNYSVFKTADSDENHTITWTRGDNTQYVDGNGVVVAVYSSYMIVSDKVAVYISTRGTPSYIADSVGGANFSDDMTTISITISGSSINVVSDGTTAVNLMLDNVTWYALPDNNGTHKLHQSIGDSTFSINSIDQLYGLMNVSTNSLGVVSFIGDEATLPDGTIVSMKIDATKDDRYVDLYTIPQSKGYFLDPDYLTNADGSVIAPYFYLVPNVVYAHTEQQMSTTALLSAVPIIAILSVIVAGIYVFLGRKY